MMMFPMLTMWTNYQLPLVPTHPENCVMGLTEAEMGKNMVQCLVSYQNY